MDRRIFVASTIGAAAELALKATCPVSAGVERDTGSAIPAPVRKIARMPDGDFIEYGIFGDRGPFIFLGPHNYLTPPKTGGRKQMTREYVAGLADRYRLIVADWPRGFGRSSPARTGSMTCSNVVRDIQIIADHAGADRFAWWGYSFGGAVALQLARKSRRISAVFCGGWPPLWQPVSDLLGKLRAQARRQVAHGAADSSSNFEHQMTLGSIAFYESIVGQDDWLAIQEIECPRMVLHDVADILPAVEAGYGQTLDFSQRTRTEESQLKALGWEVAWVDTGKGHLAMLDTKAMLAAFGQFFDRVLMR